MDIENFPELMNPEGRTPINFIRPTLTDINDRSTTMCAIVSRIHFNEFAEFKYLEAIHIEVGKRKRRIAVEDYPGEGFKVKFWDEDSFRPYEFRHVKYANDPLAMMLIRDVLDKENESEGNPPLKGLLFKDMMVHPSDQNVRFFSYTLWHPEQAQEYYNFQPHHKLITGYNGALSKPEWIPEDQCLIRTE